MTRLVYRAPPRLLTETTPPALRPVRFPWRTRWLIVTLRDNHTWRQRWWNLIYLMRG